MEKTIGLGILGFAHGHVNAYCDEWRNPAYGIKVVAGWDHDPARLNTAKSAYGLDICASAEELLLRNDIQAVVIASETSMHADLAELAAAHGKAIVLQKPMALTMSEADRIVEAVHKHSVPFTVAWQMRVDPQNLQMKKWLESGELGKVFMVRRRHGLPMGLQAEFADSWHVDPVHNRDIWADDSSHPVDFFQFLLGVPESVTAEVASLYNPRIPNDNGIVIYRYPDGPLAEVNCSFTCLAAENTMEIICERGTIVQNYGDVPSCNVPRPDHLAGLKRYDAQTRVWMASEIDSPPNHGHRIRGLAKPLAEFLRGERGPIATAEEGRTSLRMVLASYVSSRDGRRVRLDDPSIAKV
ncbi:Gfo/Idh/MocA family oxidoreductase [Paenibacillus alginolyticus]|uniref:Gfo/Idh/MocA family oxidoreductase n=1 Tax=Paenibacillus alginolyticus TaxID=59839 RepID=A0ABT4GMM0_9BACL|nr:MULTISPECIES: Gfo/Idh/MocA family oxidoreductase [Paenibacillus]MCY9669204.1 Gfo/Idh/MocA family oxidoreductase [Paenibacillus alginolyticus]MCY9697455.1 Gfo/Idh/MocA family oxidoreductase [Paenibacillus alginolyticus]MEC0148488.1 Gfo/Idh/MocA family oxidoreductase [Paenibacillus alginolyticus]NRF95365.1 Gfo/Idh/MocA family oxidoreductase [Paenibacillus frigoriresistens]